MRWIAPTEKDTTNQTPEKRLWASCGGEVVVVKSGERGQSQHG